MYMDAAEYLQSIRATNISIHNKIKQLKLLDYKLEASGISYDRDRVNSTPRKDGVEIKAIRDMEKRDEIQKDLDEKIEWMYKRIDEATDYISQMESEEQREVLILRYIECKSWAEILEERGCDDIRNQYRLHERALTSFQEVINNAVAIP